MNLSINSYRRPLQFGNSRSETQQKLLASRAQVQKQLNAEKTQAEADKLSAQIERAVNFAEKDFGNGVTGKKVLMALFMIYSSPRNAIFRTLNPNKTFKLRKKIDAYFIKDQRKALNKALFELTGVQIKIKFVDEQIVQLKDPIIKGSFKNVGRYIKRYSFRIHKSSITPEQQEIITTALKQLGVINESGGLDLSMSENYGS